MSDSYPVPAFHFTVSFTGGGPSVSDAAFQEVSGLEHGLDLEPVTEGGENRFIHQLPKPAKTPNIKLKRGISPESSELMTWCKNTIETDLARPVQPKDLKIDLLDEEGDPVCSWALTRAYPVKWTVGGFDAMKNEIAVETIELAVNTIKRTL